MANTHKEAPASQGITGRCDYNSKEVPLAPPNGESGCQPGRGLNPAQHLLAPTFTQLCWGALWRRLKRRAHWSQLASPSRTHPQRFLLVGAGARVQESQCHF